MENNVKKSFVMYTEHYDLVRDLSNPEKGWLFDAICLHAMGSDVHGTPPSGEALMAFKFISKQMDRDCDKYEKFLEKQRDNGKKGGRPKLNPEVSEETQKTQAFFGKPKKAYNVDDNVDDNVRGNIPLITPPQKTEEVKKPKQEKTNGTKIEIYLTQFDGQIPNEWFEWCTNTLQWQPERIRNVFEGFYDYWLGKSGQNASKRDWFATWRNWCRNNNERSATSASRPNGNYLTAGQRHASGVVLEHAGWNQILSERGEKPVRSGSTEQIHGGGTGFDD